MAELRGAVVADRVVRPHVVVHVAVSVDGATTGFAPDVGRFYELARTWHEDVTLAGADTILAQEEALAAQPGPGPADGGPLLAVVDSRRRVRAWRALRDAGHWSAVVALRSRAGGADGGPLAAETSPTQTSPTQTSPAETNPGETVLAAAPDDPGAVDELVVGENRVDLGAALDALGERGAKVVRVDSGGALTGAMLRAGLVDEISLLVHPCLAEAADGHLWFGTHQPPASALRLMGAETFDDAVVWLRYRR
ncbi:dihydrofolate reductase family protein [Promicromonospora iranensis]|uniref:2,5-diamino-6-(Ribosylamino)-4(3H)-pyrimidinone 5'-phosphate reductase n=1 Tax=Promicromonospora iranensis TaxID=1105144 RepID=A0ABU2CUJ8_9MICO|nr:dihydrofolate reductase family protein [Promicromonospora iranensis]MDR7385020.1 2,5-diamino-6-(ribosylamino)-4(3H)-pyrimidinone 5'-phosphate reductase [Promicromonospora iranensis]